MSTTSVVNTGLTTTTTTSTPPFSSALLSFTLFPKLPIELRRKIFEHALPTVTIIIVKANIFESAPGTGKHVNYTIGEEHFMSSELQIDINLLKACQESRTVYLGCFKYSLPTGLGKIYFDHETEIYVTNYARIELSNDIRKALSEKAANSSRGYEIIVKNIKKISLLFGLGRTIPPENICHVRTFSDVIGVPKVQGWRLFFKVGVSKGAVTVSICIGFWDAIQEFEHILRMEEIMSNEDQLSHPFYVSLDEEDESMMRKGGL